MIDICSIIHSDIGKTTPSDEDSIIIGLQKEKVLSNNITNKILLMKGFRNLLVHRYEEIDNKLAYLNIKNGLADFNTFIKEIEIFLNKTKTSGNPK